MSNLHTRGLVRLILSTVALGCAVLLCELHAQGMNGDPTSAPSQVGQMTGPHALGPYINASGNEWAEITHMVTLPPPNNEYVLFWCRRNYAVGTTPASTSLNTLYRTWLWNKNSPDGLVEVDIAGTADGRLDPFCGCHIFLPGSEGNGDKLIVMGGTDMDEWIHQLPPIPPDGPARPVGTRGVFEFDNAEVAIGLPLPVWTRRADMQEYRFYPSCLREADGTPVVYGARAISPEPSRPRRPRCGTARSTAAATGR